MKRKKEGKITNKIGIKLGQKEKKFKGTDQETLEEDGRDKETSRDRERERVSV